MIVLDTLENLAKRARTAVAYKLPMDDQPFTASRAADEIEAQAAERGDLHDGTVAALCAHLRHLDEAVMCIPSVVRVHPTPALIAHRTRILQAFVR